MAEPCARAVAWRGVATLLCIMDAIVFPLAAIDRGRPRDRSS